ncbi:uncharacterized protein LOC105696891 [Orussus abietinus]|uniref:uncharacterized protein LOC105696891 n=1 Tax=Orussus abietinus TaxID=222816 RepID=UPI0006251E55|nr:uncharacterized protein LOC105696891 [Orussus abietinus]
MSDQSTIGSSEISVLEDVCLRGKKRRLDHLTWEEKLQRKKLKNRVAAQTSRDRKKARLDELEETVKLLREKNDDLTRQCAALRSENEALIENVKRLKREKEEGKANDQFCLACQGHVGCTAFPTGSAASPKYPQPQGGAIQPASSLAWAQRLVELLKIMTFYLLLKNCSETLTMTTTSNVLKSLQRVFYEKLQQKWELIHQTNTAQIQKITKNTMTQEWWMKLQKMWIFVELLHL